MLVSNDGLFICTETLQFTPLHTPVFIQGREKKMFRFELHDNLA